MELPAQKDVSSGGGGLWASKVRVWSKYPKYRHCQEIQCSCVGVVSVSRELLQVTLVNRSGLSVALSCQVGSNVHSIRLEV